MKQCVIHNNLRILPKSTQQIWQLFPDRLLAAPASARYLRSGSLGKNYADHTRVYRYIYSLPIRVLSANQGEGSRTRRTRQTDTDTPTTAEGTTDAQTKEDKTNKQQAPTTTETRTNTKTQDQDSGTRERGKQEGGQ